MTLCFNEIVPKVSKPYFWRGGRKQSVDETIHEQIRHHAQKRENRLFLQSHNSWTTMNPQLLHGKAVREGRYISKSKREAYCRYRSWATVLQSLTEMCQTLPNRVRSHVTPRPPTGLDVTHFHSEDWPLPPLLLQQELTLHLPQFASYMASNLQKQFQHIMPNLLLDSHNYVCTICICTHVYTSYVVNSNLEANFNFKSSAVNHYQYAQILIHWPEHWDAAGCTSSVQWPVAWPEAAWPEAAWPGAAWPGVVLE